MSDIQSMEKFPLQSKKFLAYLVGNIINKALLFYMVYAEISPTLISWGITTAIFIDVGYILGQAGLDLFVRLAHIKAPSNPVLPEKPEEDEITEEVVQPPK